MNAADITKAITLGGHFTVAGGAQYPMLGEVRFDCARETPEGVAAGAPGGAVETQRFRFSSALVAASASAAKTAMASLGTLLNRDGAAVVITGSGAHALTLAAEGDASGGTLPGFPRTRITNATQTGTCVTFDVEVEWRRSVPAASAVEGYNLVSHDWTITTSTDENGEVQTRRSGRLRVKNGQSAAGAAEDLVLEDARDDADTNGRPFTSEVREFPDASYCEYSYTSAPENETGFGGVTVASVRDVTRLTPEGRTERTVSGYAEGPSADAYADSVEPAATATMLQTERSKSVPSVPEGRVEFSFKFLAGVTDAGFHSGAVIFRFTESVTPIGGGRPVSAAEFWDRDPVLFKGLLGAYAYEQRTSVEFTNCTHAQAEASGLLDALMDADNQVNEDRFARGTTAEGTKTVSIVRVFLYATAQTVPVPRQVVGL